MSAPVAAPPRPGSPARRRRAPEATGSGHGWKEQVRRVSELCLLGVVAALLSLLVLPLGAVVATVSVAVGHWADTDELPTWSATAREFRRRFLPGCVVSVLAVLAGLLVVREQELLRSGTVPGGETAAVVLLIVTGVLLAAVLLGVPQLATTTTTATATAGDTAGDTARDTAGDTAGNKGWRAALAGGWRALLRAPLAGVAALAVTAVAVLLSLLLPGVFLVLPALWVLALHAVHRRLVVPGDPSAQGAAQETAALER